MTDARTLALAIEKALKEGEVDILLEIVDNTGKKTVYDKNVKSMHHLLKLLHSAICARHC